MNDPYLEDSFGIQAGTLPCGRCGGVAQAEREKARILGEYHGIVCLDCLLLAATRN